MVLGTDVAGPLTAAVTEAGDLAEELIGQAGTGIGGLGAGIGGALAAVVNEVSQVLSATDGRTIIDFNAADFCNAITEGLLGERYLESPVRVRLSLLSLMGIGFVYLTWRVAQQQLAQGVPASSVASMWRGEFKALMSIVPSVDPGALTLPSIDLPNISFPQWDTGGTTPKDLPEGIGLKPTDAGVFWNPFGPNVAATAAYQAFQERELKPVPDDWKAAAQKMGYPAFRDFQLQQGVPAWTIPGLWNAYKE